MVIIMNISEEKRTQICAALAKAQQDIKRIQAAGVMDISEVERVYRALQDVVQELRILINQCIAMRRHRSRTVPMNEAEEASQFYDFSTDLEFNDLLKTLPEDSRLIFQMYYGEQFSIGEIAQLLHMKENTVKSKIHRGREHLRSQMGVGKENSHDKQSVD